MNDVTISAPWYRHGMPWLLLLGPVIVVVASLATAWIAFSTADGLVAADYYKQGLAINRTLSREARAATLHLSATLRFTDRDIRVVIAGPRDVQKEVPLGGATPVLLRITHPTRAGLDRIVPLALAPDGAYVGKRPMLDPGRWELVLESDAWRLTGEWSAAGSDDVFILKAAQPADM
jgi:hypothetical protein